MNVQYITDPSGKKVSVILPIKEFNSILEELEELQDIRLYDQAKREDNGQRTSFEEYLKKRKSS